MANLDRLKRAQPGIEPGTPRNPGLPKARIMLLDHWATSRATFEVAIFIAPRFYGTRPRESRMGYAIM